MSTFLYFSSHSFNCQQSSFISVTSSGPSSFLTHLSGQSRCKRKICNLLGDRSEPVPSLFSINDQTISIDHLWSQEKETLELKRGFLDQVTTSLVSNFKNSSIQHNVWGQIKMLFEIDAELCPNSL